MTSRKEPRIRKHYFEEDGFVTTTFKLTKSHRDALEVLSRKIGESMSMIVRRLVREELYYRGLIDDELL